jgi:hypothetical protein
MRHAISNRSKQNGQALLAMVIIFIAASTYVLVTKLNANARQYSNQSSNLAVLNEAKAALIGYALNFPEIDATSPGDPINGPGYLPCPDKDNDGDADSPCALAGPTNFTIGRFPYKSLEVSELRDSSGARLWYALSENYRNNPQLEPLNSETPGQLTVNGNGDIVAVIIAPGAPIGNQNRDPTDTNILTEIANYLETENNDLDLDFNSIDPSVIDVSDFNDRLITLTRQELMAAIEKRVLGEAKTVLTTYKTSGTPPPDAYPWLSPFADPKTNEKRLAGSHSGADNQATLLTDASADFTQWGVAIGDVVWNITDGSYGLVTVTPAALTKTTLTIGGGMTLGSENDFDTDDEYYVDVAVPVFATPFIGTATATAGSGLVLTDTNQDFDALGVQVGDIVDNLTNGKSRVIERVDTTQLTVSSLPVPPADINDVFASADVYRIRTSMGRATSAGGLTLNDTNVDFTVMGIQVGDLVHNVTDGSFGRVLVAPTANSLTVTELNLGTNNTFSINDYYAIPRFNSITNTREGLLPFHEQGEYFHTAFDIDWSVNVSAVSNTGPSTDATYNGSINNFVQASSNNSGTVSISDAQANCTWIAANLADCKGSLIETQFITGTVDTTGVVSTVGRAATNADGFSSTLIDNNINFTNTGIKAGDIVINYSAALVTPPIIGTADAGSATTILIDAAQNFITSGVEPRSYLITNNTDGTTGIVLSVDSAIQLEVLALPNFEINFDVGDSYTIQELKTGVVSNSPSANTLDVIDTSDDATVYQQDDNYRVRVATRQIAERAEAGTDLPTFHVNDSDADFSDVRIGDAVTNVTQGGFGLITALGVDANGPFFKYTALNGGQWPDIATGEGYRIYHTYIDKREYEFNVKINGSLNINNEDNVRKRDVCLGYGADCTSAASDTTLTGDGVTNLIKIIDFDSSDIEVGSANATLPIAGVQGSLKLSNLDFFLSEDYDSIPGWFFNNSWHQLIYVAYSAGDAPGAAAACVPGTNCLTINSVDNTGAPVVKTNNNNALVVSAGMEINTTTDSNCNNIVSTAQNRANGTMNEYYESDNCDADDDGFQQQSETTTFNDQVRVVEP